MEAQNRPHPPLRILSAASGHGFAFPPARFDDVARSVAEVLEVPVALVSFLAGAREVVRGAHGTEVRELARASSLCEHVVRQEGVLVVEDASRDRRFQRHPLVAAPDGVRFLAGAPVRTPDGVAVGAVMAVDVEPRYCGAREMSALTALAASVSRALELHRARLDLEASQRAYRAQAAVLEAVLAGTPDAVVLTDAAGRLAVLNAPAERLLAGDAAPSALRPMFSAEVGMPGAPRTILAAGTPAADAVVQATRRSPVAGARLTLPPRPDAPGGTPVALHAQPLRDAEGRVVGTAALLREEAGSPIGPENNRSEAALRAAAADLTSAALSVLSPAGAVAWANEAFEGLTGWGQEAVGRDLWALLGLDDAEGMAVRAAAQARERWGGDLALRRRDGAPYEAHVRVTPLPGSGALVVEQVNLRDRTRWASDLDAAHRRLRHADRLKAEFLTNVGFEIRTPLTSLLGFSELLGADLADRDAGTPASRDFLRIIGESGERLLGLLDALQDLALLEHDRLGASAVAQDLRPIVEAAVGVGRARAATQGLRLEADLPDVPLGAAVDPESVGRILRTLIHNGLRHTAEGGVLVRAWAEGGDACISVRDTGAGFSTTALDRLRRDLAAEDAVARTDGGIGLRLTVAKRLAALLGGRIEVDSERGAGSVLTLRLPGAAVPPAAPRRPRVLLAVGGAAARAASHGLGDAAEVDHADTVLAALTLAAERRYDAVLLALDLGERGAGVGVLRALRQRPDYARVPVLALTARLFPSDREHLLRLGFDAALARPLAPDALRAAVAEALRSAAAPGEA